jgi:hypothetical protein
VQQVMLCIINEIFSCKTTYILNSWLWSGSSIDVPETVSPSLLLERVKSKSPFGKKPSAEDPVKENIFILFIKTTNYKYNAVSVL